MTKIEHPSCWVNLQLFIFTSLYYLLIQLMKNPWLILTTHLLIIFQNLMYIICTLLQTYVADIFLAQSWRDPRLRLPENMYEEYRILDVDWLNNIWRPDCFFKNAKKVTFHEMSIPNHYLWLYHDKTLLYMSK